MDWNKCSKVLVRDNVEDEELWEGEILAIDPYAKTALVGYETKYYYHAKRFSFEELGRRKEETND